MYIYIYFLLFDTITKINAQLFFCKYLRTIIIILYIPRDHYLQLICLLHVMNILNMLRIKEISLVAIVSTIYCIIMLLLNCTELQLSDSLRFSHFARIVPSDLHQAIAIVDLILHFRWYYISVVATQGEYGEGGAQVT